MLVRLGDRHAAYHRTGAVETLPVLVHEIDLVFVVVSVLTGVEGVKSSGRRVPVGRRMFRLGQLRDCSSYQRLSAIELHNHDHILSARPRRRRLRHYDTYRPDWPAMLAG